MGAEDRADPRGYIQAVAVKLAELGVGNGGATPVERPGGRGRAMAIHFDGFLEADDVNFADAESLRLGWDEERGWALHEIQPGQFRPGKADRYALRLGLVPEPAEVAQVVRQLLAGDLWRAPGEGPRLRRSAADDADLEAALAAYPQS